MENENIQNNTFNIYICGGGETMKVAMHTNKKTSFNIENCPNGIYILTNEHRCILPNNWGENDPKSAIGIAVIEDDHRFVVALKGSADELILLDEDTKITSTPYDKLVLASDDFNGRENTESLLKLDSPVAKFCHEYECGPLTKGSWWLPSLGELKLMNKHKNLIDACLTICGSESLHYGWHWSSTAYSPQSAWLLQWFDGARYYYIRGYSNRVRPVTSLEF